MKWILLAALFPVVAESQVQRKPVIQPVLSVVYSGPSAPLYQVGGGLRYGKWSYEVRYGWDMAIGPNTGSASFYSVEVLARQHICDDVFYWMAGVIYARYLYNPPAFDRGLYFPGLSVHTWNSTSPALGLGVGYKYIFLELQAYYPGLLIGIRVGLN